MMDNASNNNMLITALNAEVAGVSSEQRLRCAGHIINLVVKTILCGEEISDFKKEIIRCSDSKVFELWRKFGALGRIHKMVKYIMRSDQRRQHFNIIQGRERTKNTEDNSLFQHTAKLLIKGGGVG